MRHILFVVYPSQNAVRRESGQEHCNIPEKNARTPPPPEVEVALISFATEMRFIFDDYHLLGDDSVWLL
jgi:hypothetical protein